MKNVTLFSFLLISLIFSQSCSEAPKDEKLRIHKPITAAYETNREYTIDEYNNTKGCSENGQIITDFDCPDSRFFQPINLKSWDKTPVVNGRFPSYEETMNGTSIHHYGEKENPDIKPYYMVLPKLAYRRNPLTGIDDIVVVIQIVQTKEDTVVGFRYLTGGCGGSEFSNYRFLTNEEVRKAVAQ